MWVLSAWGLFCHVVYLLYFFSYSVSPLDEEADEDGDLSDLDIGNDELQNNKVWYVLGEAINHVEKICGFMLKTNQVKLFCSIWMETY